MDEIFRMKVLIMVYFDIVYCSQINSNFIQWSSPGLTLTLTQRLTVELQKSEFKLNKAWRLLSRYSHRLISSPLSSPSRVHSGRRQRCEEEKIQLQQLDICHLSTVFTIKAGKFMFF